jgi:hypothetical protein
MRIVASPAGLLVSGIENTILLADPFAIIIAPGKIESSTHGLQF